VFVFYLWLTAGSGSVWGLWSKSELVLGVVLSLFTGIMTLRHTDPKGVASPLSPKRWLTFFLYILGPFFVEMAKANLDVAYRVITGKINPGIIRVKSGMHRDGSVVALANSITLTPGTLTVGVDEETNDLFIHKINLEGAEAEKTTWEARELFSLDLPAWIRRFAE